MAELRPYIAAKLSAEALLLRWKHLPAIDPCALRSDLHSSHDPGAGMRHVATAAVLGLLLTSCTTPPAEYHDVVQHPYVLREATATLMEQRSGFSEQTG